MLAVVVVPPDGVAVGPVVVVTFSTTRVLLGPDEFEVGAVVEARVVDDRCTPVVPGDALVGVALVGDALVGDALVGDPLVGDALLGDALVGDALVGDALVGGVVVVGATGSVGATVVGGRVVGVTLSQPLFQILRPAPFQFFPG